MSDIRKFFGVKPQPKAESGQPKPAAPAATGAAPAPKAAAPAPSKPAAPSPKPVAPKPKAEEPPVKRSKYFGAHDSDDGDGSDSDLVISRSKPAPALAAAATAAKGGPSPKQAAAKPAAAGKPGGSKRRTMIIDSDVEYSASDEDDDADFSAESESEDESVEDASASDSDSDVKALKPGSKRKGKEVKPAAAGKRQAVVSSPAGAPASGVGKAAPAAAVPKAAPVAATPASGGGAKASASASGSAGKGKKGKPEYAAAQMNPGAAEAIRAVDEAVKALPEEKDVKFEPQAPGSDPVVTEGLPPPLHGQKEAPRGHPDCLTGKTFVITGVLESLYRHEAEDLIKRHGGRVTGAVSGKTSFLLAGSQCGFSKLREARNKETKIIDEDGLFSLINATKHLVPQGQPPPSAPPSQQTAAAAPGLSTLSFYGSKPPASQAAPPSRPPPSSYSGAGTSAGAAASLNAQLWVDKYKPRSSAELVGNNTLVDTLRRWLTTWADVHLRGQAPPAQAGSSSSKAKDMGKKAVLLSGPPGIGKTSAAHIIAREAGFHVVEVNASDTRSKASVASKGVEGKVANVVKEMCNNAAISLGGGAPRRQVLVMDEVDGMSGGDRGGVADLIQTIARSKVPIVCICNDKWSQKLKSLRNHCLELEFRKPTVQQISKRMLDIAAREGLSLNQATMDALVEGANGDLRLVLGQLQMVRLRAAALSYDEVKGRLGTSKDADMSPFDAARKLLEPGAVHADLGTRSDWVFMDMDMVPLLLQENYLNHRPVVANTEAMRMRAMAKAADAISAGDVLTSRLRRVNDWALAPAAVMIGSLLPAAYMRGPREIFGLYPGEQNFPRFTAWLGNYSTSTKQRRLLSELTTAMAASGSVSSARGSVRLEYLSALRSLLTRPLVLKQEAAIPEVVSLMQAYCIDREHFDAVVDMTQFKSKAAWAEDPMKGVETKVKSAFTRTFNKQGLKPRMGSMVEAPTKKGKGKGKKGAGGAAPGGLGEDDEALEAEEGGGAEGTEQPASGGAAEAEESEEEQETSKLERKLARLGGTFQGKGSPKGGKKSGGGSGRGSGAGGRGSGRGGGSGRGSGRGSGASTSSGRGGGRGKK